MKKCSMALAVTAALYASAAMAQSDGNTTDDSARTLDKVSVIGVGQTHEVLRVQPEQVAVLPPGSSPLKALSALPGVSFQSSDAFGAYEWSTRIHLRGFNQSQLGFTLDGIPLGNMMYGNDNGLHISRALISENLGSAEVAEGVGGVSTATSGNLGGTLQFYSDDPSSEFGVKLAQTFGSDNTRRTYARLDTGDHDGFSMYLSGMTSDTDKWKGVGPQKQTQFNAKALYDFGEGNRIGVLVTTSERNETDYQDVSKQMVDQLGWNIDNSHDWAEANAIGQSIKDGYSYADLPAKYQGLADPWDASYYDGRGLRNDQVYNLFGDFTLSDNVTAHAQVYHHEDRGQGHWWSPWRDATWPDDELVALRTTEYGINRTGEIASLNWNAGDINDLEVGIWHETNDNSAQRNFYFFNAPVSDNYFLKNPDERVWYQTFHDTTRQFYVKDTLKLLDGRLNIEAGFKGTDVKIDAAVPDDPAIQQTLLTGSLESKDNFLPQVGATFKLDAHNEIFATYADNMAAYLGGLNGPLNTSQAGYDAEISSLKPERSKTVELGYRFSGGNLQASLTAYHVKYEDRLLAINPCSAIQTGPECVTQWVNVGSVTGKGVDALVVWKIMDGLRWSNSLSFNDTTYDSDYSDGGSIVPTGGKTVIDSPKQMFSSTLGWSVGAFELDLDASYTGKRYYAYTDVGSVDGFWLSNLGASYDFGKAWKFSDLKLAFNVTNLLDKKYFGTINSAGFVVADPDGTAQTLQVGAPRQVFVTLSAGF